MNKIIVLGTMEGYEKINRVYSIKGLSPVIETAQGGGRQPYILVEVKDERIDFSRDDGQLGRNTRTLESGLFRERSGADG